MRKTLLMVVLVLVACGDPATGDDRAYTKAPLERPGLMVRGEPAPALAGVAADLEPGLVGWVPESERPRGGDGPEQEAGSGESAASLAAGVSQAQFDRGRELFTGTGGCMACHGMEAGGSQLGPDLTDDEWLNLESPDVAAIAALIQSGVAEPQEYPAPMPAMGGASLSEAQVRALAGYVASISSR